jgi:hypothetical protein
VSCEQEYEVVADPAADRVTLVASVMYVLQFGADGPEVADWPDLASARTKAPRRNTAAHGPNLVRRTMEG